MDISVVVFLVVSGNVESFIEYNKCTAITVV